MATPTNLQTPRRPVRGPAPGALTRRSTRGPLDGAGVPSSMISPTPGTLSPRAGGGLPVYQSMSPGREHSPARPFSTQKQPKDFARLLRPEIYHPLTQLETPAPFRQPSKQPSPDSPLETLLSSGHFRAAAIMAANRLTNEVAVEDHQIIFDLFYVRLVCLVLCGSTTLAAQEVKALEDLNSSNYRDDLTSQHLVPWELRVLAVRLQGMGFNDARKGVMGYYDLARDARAELAKLEKDGFGDTKEREKRLWEVRLGDLGIRVASALVEMGDVEAAAHHLNTLKETEDGELDITKALLWLRMGDTQAARRQAINGEVGMIEALCSMADGEYETAIDRWKALSSKDSDNEMYAQNLAVCLLYSCRMDEAREVLEALVDAGESFHALTFNLSTIYELCTDKNRNLKMTLAERVAELENNHGSGWEKANIDFKL